MSWLFGHKEHIGEIRKDIGNLKLFIDQAIRADDVNGKDITDEEAKKQILEQMNKVDRHCANVDETLRTFIEILTMIKKDEHKLNEILEMMHGFREKVKHINVAGKILNMQTTPAWNKEFHDDFLKKLAQLAEALQTIETDTEKVRKEASHLMK